MKAKQKRLMLLGRRKAFRKRRRERKRLAAIVRNAVRKFVLRCKVYDIKEKQCMECGMKKPIEEFKIRKNWIVAKCFECEHEKGKEYGRNSYWKNIEENRWLHRLRWQEHKEHYSEMSRKWERLRKAKYKGKIKGAHTYREWLAKLKEYDYKCVYCKCELHLTKDNRDGQQATRDHIIPLSQIKLTSDDISNIVPCCRRCNSSKGKSNEPKTKFGSY